MRLFLPLVVLLAMPGCLPYGCSRTESRVLSPADSLSRAYAETVRVDTLTPAGSLSGPFEHPRTVGFGGDGALYVTDVGTHRLVVRDSTGTESAIGLDSLRYPYLAGFAGGLPVVYSPEVHRVAAIGVPGWSVAVPDEGRDEQTLRYALATADGLWLKVLSPDRGGFLLRFGRDGEVAERIDLPGPHWQYAGLLRWWEGRPVSLSGYLPVVHRVRWARVDTLVLHGFDSPMLARSRQFLRGDVHAPPLLTASAAPLDSTLFVMNMRPGWLRVDAYGRDGRLRAVYVEPDPAFDQDFYPTDLAVRAVVGGFELAVAVTEPEPGVRLYRWTAPAEPVGTE